MTPINPLGHLPPPTPADMKALRKAAGLSQRAAADLVGLSDAMRWSDYERSVHVISPQNWALFLLAIGQHPRLRIAVRRASAASHAPGAD